MKLLSEDTGYKVTDILEFDPETSEGKCSVEGGDRLWFKMTPEKTDWEPLKDDK